MWRGYPTKCGDEKALRSCHPFLPCNAGELSSRERSFVLSYTTELFFRLGLKGRLCLTTLGCFCTEKCL